MHLLSVQSEDVLDFTRTCWETYRTSMRKWLSLQGETKDLAETYKLCVDIDFDNVPDDAGIHMTCYQRFICEGRLSLAEKKQESDAAAGQSNPSASIADASQPRHLKLHERNFARDMNFKIRPATKEDCKGISRMIMELAVYVKMPDQVKISHEELERDGFCQNPFFECLVAEVPEENKSTEGFTLVGYAFYFYTYSTWKGRSVYLEDLYVMPEFRGNGIGKGLLSKVAEVGKKKQCVRLQMSVFDWNTPSRDFYAAKGAQNLTESEGWHFIRFDNQSLDNLANEAPKD